MIKPLTTDTQGLFRLDGQTALVTGGSKGLGEAMARALAGAGADVVITSRHLEEAQTVADRISQDSGQQVIAFQADAGDRQQADASVAHTIQRLGKLDILVNNAGVNIPCDALELSESDWDAVQGVNLKGLFFLSQRCARHMKEHGGRVVNMASINGVVGYYKRAAYCSSKAGVVNLTRVLALEWAQYDINVNAVGPTFILTPLTQSTFDDPVLREDLIQRIPKGRVGMPEDVVGAVVFLASPAAAMITGHTLMVDGGWTAI